MKIVEQVCDVLRSLDAPWALIGGHAVGARGFPRMTVDYDFLTTDRRVLDASTWATLEATGARIDVRHGDPDDPLAGVVRITMADAEVDVVVGKWAWLRNVLERSEWLDFGGVRAPVPRTSDLILLKLAAGGPIDLQDAIVLLEVADTDAVVREVDERVAEAGPEAVAAWREIRRPR